MRRGIPLLFLIPLALFAQDDPTLDELREADLERILNRSSLTEMEQALFKPVSKLPAWEPDYKAEKIRVRVVPLSFSDSSPDGPPKWVEALSAYMTAQSGGRLELQIGTAATLPVAMSRRDALGTAKESRQEFDLVGRVIRAAGASDVDAVLLVHPGELIHSRSSFLWPHQSSVRIGDREILYTVVPEKGLQASSIACHEFLHLFGLPDKAETRECILAYGYELLDVCASCRGRLGWGRVGVLDPKPSSRVSMEEGDILRIRASRGDEALVVGFEEGSLRIWHQLRGDSEFIVSIDGRTRDRLTPHSDPGFRAKTRGSSAVYLTDVWIEAESKRAFFVVSPRGEMTSLEKHNVSRTGRRLGATK